MAKQKSLVTVKKRILLHLLNCHNANFHYDVSDKLTQNGIAKAVGTWRNFVSECVKKLIAQGQVQECTGHVKRRKMKQKYYILTPEGKEYTKNLKSELSEREITLKLPDSQIKMMKLKKIMPFLTNEKICPDVTELDIYKITSKDGILDIENLKKARKERLVDFSPGAPKIEHFFGRKKEMTTLKEWIEDNEGHNIIFIHGMAGIGKTTLAAKLIEDYRQSKHLFWHNFHELDTLRGMLLRLAEFLSKLGDDHLEIYLRAHPNPDYYEVSRIIGKRIGVIDAVLIFDDFHKSCDKIRSFFIYIKRMLASSSKTKVLILSREIVPFYNERDVIGRQIIAELEVEGLDFKSSKTLLRKKNIDKKRFKEIYDFTGGNPLFLEIIESKDRLERYMHHELFSRLNKDDRKILGIISIYRYHVLEDSLAVNDDFDFEKLFVLTQKSLVKKDANNRYFVHDIIRQFFYCRLSPSQRKKYHLLAAQWFENRDEPIDFIEAIYHYQEAGEYKKTSQLAIDSSASILNGGHAAELLVILERFKEKNLETSLYAEILVLKGKACNMCGEWKKALLYFNESADVASISGNKKLEVKTIYESGHILEEQNELQKAMECFEKCLDISKERDYLSGIGEGYRGIGRVYWRKSEHEKAIVNFRKCLEISERLGDLELMGSTYIDLGNVYDERYETEKAIECYNKSLDFLKKVRNTYETARAYLNLAMTYEHLDEFEKAIEYNTKHLILAQNLRDMKLLGYGYANISYCFAKIEEFIKGMEYATKAEEIALKIDNKNIMPDVYKTYGLVCWHEEKYDEAIDYFKRSIEIAESQNALYYLSDSHFEFGLLYKEIGDTKNAKKHFDKATRLYNKLGLGKTDLVKEKLSSYNEKISII
jgi:tetratricopeptide (TPR) repeat protein/DNA-binding MarR family transcriptional regulator